MPARSENPRGRDTSGPTREATLRKYLGRRKLATVVAAALALFVGYHVIFGHNGLTVYWQKRQDRQQLTERLRALQAENGGLKEHVDQLQHDPDAIEHQARMQLHYTRPGEVIYTLPDSGAGQPTDSK